MRRLGPIIIGGSALAVILLWGGIAPDAQRAGGKNTGAGPMGAPPEAFVDALIDGNGDGLYGAHGSGAGGSTVQTVFPPVAVDLVLELQNEGGRADGYTVTWDSIPGWVATVDGTSSPFVSENIPPPNSRFYTFHVEVPAVVAPGEYVYILDVTSGRDPSVVESVEARFVIEEPSAVVHGVVFDDANHDGAYSVGENGVSGVTVLESVTGATSLTAGDGTYVLSVPAGIALGIVERNPSGFLSTSPDTVAVAALAMGDTIVVNFGDVAPLRLSAGMVRNGVAGSYVDFLHTVEAGTAGPVVLAASASAGAVTQLFLDGNANGVLDVGERPLLPTDLDMDPEAGRAVTAILLRVLVPAGATPGTTLTLQLAAEQTITGTSLVSSATATDAVLIVSGPLLVLQKAVDASVASPGDVLTYTITFVNSGSDSVQNVVILDPISAHVDPLADAFGPGQDVEWVRAGGGTLYLTLDSSDADECEYRSADHSISLRFSKNSPYFLQPGEQGTLRYRVTVR